MISTERYKAILEKGLTLDHYVTLKTIRDGKEPLQSKRIQGFINLLSKKGLLQEGSITSKGYELLEGDIDLITDIIPTITTVDTTTKAPFNLNEWALEVHRKCQDSLKSLTGKTQIRARINSAGPSYPFLPNANDFVKILIKVVTIYKITDFKKVEKCLLAHVKRCYKNNSYFPLMRYYMLKDNQSQMVTDLDSVLEESDDSIDYTTNI